MDHREKEHDGALKLTDKLAWDAQRIQDGLPIMKNPLEKPKLTFDPPEAGKR